MCEKIHQFLSSTKKIHTKENWLLFSFVLSVVVMLDMKGHMVVLGTALGTLMVPGYWSLQMG